MQKHNKLSRLVQKVKQAPLFLQPWLLTKLFGSAIKFAGTAGVRVEQLDAQQSVLTLKNRRRVQNHIGGVHAAAMALLGESATGFLVGIHVPDDRIPLLKSMHIDYTKRATGDLKALASLTTEQIEQIQQQEKGEVVVSVVITDSVQVEPIQATFVWAWVPKKR
jgi:acyl-coenzyme A thioesterase PaaI-like protein